MYRLTRIRSVKYRQKVLCKYVQVNKNKKCLVKTKGLM